MKKFLFLSFVVGASVVAGLAYSLTSIDYDLDKFTKEDWGPWWTKH